MGFFEISLKKKEEGFPRVSGRTFMVLGREVGGRKQ